MKEIRNTTKAGQAIISEYNFNRNRGRRTIYQAYSRPSSEKVQTYMDILRRATETAGYNNDLTVSGAGSYNYSTLYTYTENGKTYIIKDTKSNIYKVEIA